MIDRNLVRVSLAYHLGALVSHVLEKRGFDDKTNSAIIKKMAITTLPFLSDCPFVALFMQVMDMELSDDSGKFIDAINTHIGKHGFPYIDEGSALRDYAAKLEMFLIELEKKGINWLPETEASKDIIEAMEMSRKTEV